jgi:hypothetical protein
MPGGECVFAHGKSQEEKFGPTPSQRLERAVSRRSDNETTGVTVVRAGFADSTCVGQFAQAARPASERFERRGMTWRTISATAPSATSETTMNCQSQTGTVTSDECS